MQNRRDNRTLYVVLGALLAICFVAGVANLMSVRFGMGDVYPDYSTFKPAPKGAMALYEALESISGMSVERYMKPSQRMDPQGRATIFVMGVDMNRVNHSGKSDIKEIYALASDGARVVIALDPVRPLINSPAEDLFEKIEERRQQNLERERQRRRDEDGEAQPDEQDDAGAKDEAEAQDKDKEQDQAAKDDANGDDEDTATPGKCAPRDRKCRLMRGEFYKRFRVYIDVMRMDETPLELGQTPVAGLVAADIAELPPMLQLQSASYVALDEQSLWRTVYAYNGKAVVVERAIGSGSLVIVCDPYYLTNQAMMQARQPGLIAWLVGPNSKVIFDESHFGIGENPGVASLMRKYGLGWFIASLVALAALFVWRNATSMVPKSAYDQEESASSGKDYASGMVSLMRRSVPGAEVTGVCIEEWSRSFARGRRSGRTEAAEMARQAMSGARTKDPVALYETADNILNERKRRKWKTSQRG